jgi:hypothetical protein
MADKAQSLRSAMKHPSRPTSPSPISPPLTSPTQSPASTLNSSLSSPLSPSISERSDTLLSSSYIAHSPTASTIGPNAPQGYTPKVSFDTFENPSAPMFSFTLQVKSDGYERYPSTRVFLCASSADESGRQALDWAIDSLIQDGDELIVFRGIDQDDLGRKISVPPIHRALSP